MVSSKSRSRQPFFSIVIPTLNEEKYIPLLLKDLTQQSYSDFEVVVSDGRSEDGTQRQVARFTNNLSIQFISNDVRNVAVQRNKGAHVSRGRWVLFMDADDRVAQYFLEGIHYQLLKVSKCDVCTCLIEADSPSRYAQLTASGINAATVIQEKAGTYFCLGAFIGVRKSVTAKIKFESKYSVGEDSEFVRAAARAGYRFVVFKDPTYTFSFRRLRKEGVLKMTAINAKVMLKSLGSQSLIDSHSGYVMMGGSYYTLDSQKKVTPKLITVKKITKQQLRRVKPFITELMKSIHSFPSLTNQK